jgi:hypothetical protein|uniref:Uncharacterized protein n=1 Tax=viral metagenome TaxID=1070528 RepID=A0A6C0AHA7_9ZZZZ
MAPEREVSLPLRFMEDYNKALDATTRHYWSDLEIGLSSPEADQVAIALRNYLESKQKHRTFLTIYINARDNPACDLEERGKMFTDFMDSLHDELRLRRELDTLISTSDTDTLSVSDSSDE